MDLWCGGFYTKSPKMVMNFKYPDLVLFNLFFTSKKKMMRSVYFLGEGSWWKL